ncbi:hypothetical protein FKW77_003245 [Venturia effusa]|uniref:Uncharacterized protein n=1 Tax=Venturia effusa TaxID=50376 RepID=A0A517L102_9PEZI|nr:hypothetical protein FKW77_003245 [Venturia effusa]
MQESPVDDPSIPDLKRITPKQRRVPAPIKIYSDLTDSNEHQTSIYVPALPRSSTLEPIATGVKAVTPQRAAPTPPMNRPNSILVLSAPNSARRNHTPKGDGQQLPRMSLQSQGENDWKKKFKNVRFSAVCSPAHSNLKSPAYVDCYRTSSHSPMLHSPNTYDEMEPEFSDEVLESPIEDAPMLSIAPIENTIHEEGQDFIASFSSSGGRQVDHDTLLRLTGTHPSLKAHEQNQPFPYPISVARS